MKGVMSLPQGAARLGQRVLSWVQTNCGSWAWPRTWMASATTEASATVTLNYASLAQASDFPVLSAHELIAVLELEPRIDSIRQLLGLPAPDWSLLGQSAIERVAEAVQLCPASEVHHHAYAGGLLVHTLEVAEHALRLRKRYQLPIGAGAEAINEAGPRWTYAVFAAALLHDPGKLAAGIHVLRSDGRRWTPLDRPLDVGSRYRVVFASVPYHLHAQASLALFSTLLPTEARRWLGNDPELLGQLLATTYNAGAPEGGAIAEILRQADGASVRSDLGQQNAAPLSSAQSVPLVDRLMGALWRLIADGELKVNAPGAQIWVSSGRRGGQGAEREAWVLCKSLADAVLARLREEGDSSVPGSNERVFDTLQEHGMLRATRENQAVWHVRVRLQDWSSEFRVLRFPAWRLWPPGRIPEARAKVQVLKTTSAASTAGKPVISIASHAQRAESAPRAEVDPAIIAATGDESVSTALPDDTEAGLIELLMGGKPDRKAKARTVAATPAPLPNAPIQALATGTEVTAETFLRWLSDGIEDGSIATNSESAYVHGGEDALLLVSPKAFREYATQCGGDWTSAQAALSGCGQLRRRGKRTVLPFVVSRSGAQINCVVIERPKSLGLPDVPCNSLLQPMDK